MILCPADITQGNDTGVCGAVVTYTAPVGTDNCPGAVTTQIAGLASGATFPVGTTVNTFQVTDAAGHSAQCSFNVTINDTEPPTITCPAPVVVSTDPNLCTAVVNGIAPVATHDNCGIASVTWASTGATVASGINDASGTVFNRGVSTVTYTITDTATSPNVTTCSFTVTVNDTQPPNVVCQPFTTTLSDSQASVSILPTDVFNAGASSDNCGTVTPLSVTPNTFSCGGPTR